MIITCADNHHKISPFMDEEYEEVATNSNVNENTFTTHIYTIYMSEYNKKLAFDLVDKLDKLNTAVKNNEQIEAHCIEQLHKYKQTLQYIKSLETPEIASTMQRQLFGIAIMHATIGANHLLNNIELLENLGLQYLKSREWQHASMQYIRFIKELAVYIQS